MKKKSPDDTLIGRGPSDFFFGEKAFKKGHFDIPQA
jgi:hypothetical protein